MTKRQKDEMTDMQEYMSKIKSLSQEREAFTKSMEMENEALRSTIAQLTAENEVFTRENTIIAELCLAQGVQDKSGGIPDQPIKHLILERKKLVEKVEEGGKEKARLGEELKRGLEKTSLLEKQV